VIICQNPSVFHLLAWDVAEPNAMADESAGELIISTSELHNLQTFPRKQALLPS
jgi:hypothetical protein